MAPPRLVRLLLLGASTTALIIIGLVGSSDISDAAGSIHPGTMMYTDGAQCTANFVFTDANHNTYVGYAAHCASTGGESDTNGCSTGSLPLGTPVDFTADGSPVAEGTVIGRGTLAYSSWVTEHALGTKDANTCAYNDLALVKVSAANAAAVDPTVPYWGGPTGISTGGLPTGAKVFSVSNSSLLLGIGPLQARSGHSLGDDPADGGWEHSVITIAPGVPGDSGSGFLDSSGRAVGVLSTLALPVPSNGVGDFAHELAFAQAHSGIAGLTLVHGRSAFNPMGALVGAL